MSVTANISNKNIITLIAIIWRHPGLWLANVSL